MGCNVLSAPSLRPIPKEKPLRIPNFSYWRKFGENVFLACHSHAQKTKKNSLFSVVPAARLELARPFDRQILSLLCLPFHQAGTDETLTFPVFQIKGGFTQCMSSVHMRLKRLENRSHEYTAKGIILPS